MLSKKKKNRLTNIKNFEKNLFTKYTHPDILIRTGGQCRLSNLCFGN